MYVFNPSCNWDNRCVKPVQLENNRRVIVFWKMLICSPEKTHLILYLGSK